MITHDDTPDLGYIVLESIHRSSRSTSGTHRGTGKRHCHLRSNKLQHFSLTHLLSKYIPVSLASRMSVPRNKNGFSFCSRHLKTLLLLLHKRLLQSGH